MREHWLQHAHGRIVAGDSEPDVLADYGWVQITDAERDALATVDRLRIENARLRSALVLVDEALNLEEWDGRWSNRLMHAHTVVGGVLDPSSRTPQAQRFMGDTKPLPK